MKSRMRLGDFLVAYLRKLGVDTIFGIPGDLVLKLFFRLGEKSDIRIVTLSHEPSIGFSVDGYARATGRIGVACVTYGAGGHNMVNAVAGSFSERVPILVISGGPGEGERRLGTLIHHQAKEIESQFHIYNEVTCAARILDDAATAAREVDRVVRTMWTEQRPGYLEIHRDMVDATIQVPPEIVAWDGRLKFPRSDENKLREAVAETAQRWKQSKRPLTVVGIESHRYRLGNEIVTLAEKMGAPVLSSVLAKGGFPMDHPLHMGVHIGGLSPKPMCERVARADLVLNLGAPQTDIGLGMAPPQFPRECSIVAVDNRVDVSFHSYTDVTLRHFVKELLRTRLRRHREKVAYVDNLEPQPKRSDRAVQVADVLWEVNRFLDAHRGMMVVAESGDMLFAGLDVRVPGRGNYFAQGYYASMGFGIPAALGAQIGTHRRPLVLCGDGAFQMTGSEISQAPRHGCNPIVLVMNNGGWQIFRPVAERRDLLAIPSWPYAQLAQSWGGWGRRVETVAHLREALAEAEAQKSFAVVEICVAPDDLSPVSRKYIGASARRGGASKK